MGASELLLALRVLSLLLLPAAVVCAQCAPSSFLLHPEQLRGGRPREGDAADTRRSHTK